jgi:heavy metal sensor kinase
VQKAARGRIVLATRTGPAGSAVRTLTFPIVADSKPAQAVQVGASLHDEQTALDRILLVFFISIPTSLLLLGYGGWFLAGRALKPVAMITTSARKITAENLGLRLKVENPDDEIGRLAETFNDTLARLEDSFVRTRRFSVDVSHELRTPLTIIRGDTEIGLKWAKEPDEFRTILASNMDEINRMSDIIEHLLELSRAADKKLPLIMEEVDMKELLQELVDRESTSAGDKGLNLSLDGEQEIYVLGDRKRLRQLFAALLDNAVHFTPPDGDIRITLMRDTGRARIAVRDTGIGIAAEDLPHLFDHFYRVDAARNRAHGGSGLGLSLAKSFAEAHGGGISVESTPGQGSVFTVTLPLDTAAS